MKVLGYIIIVLIMCGLAFLLVWNCLCIFKDIKKRKELRKNKRDGANDKKGE